ncbi:MAG: DUF1189 family protein [Pseudomonadota bacterium]
MSDINKNPTVTKTTGLLPAIIKAFYSADLYREVARSWRRRSFLFLLVLLAIFWALVVVVKTVQGVAFINRIADQIPNLTIEQGELKAPRHQPYFIKNPDTGAVILVIDPSDQYKDFPTSSAMLMMDGNQLLYKVGNNNNDIKSIPFDKSTKIVITPDIIRAKVRHAAPLFAVLLWLFIAVISYGFNLISALIYGFLAMLFAQALKRSLDYGQALSLALVAIGPSIVFFLLFRLFDLAIPFAWLVLLLIQIAYIYAAVHVLPELTVRNNPKV